MKDLVQKLIWWGEAPGWPENINEGTDVGNLQGQARPILVPSRGAAVSLVLRFGARNGRTAGTNNAFNLVHTIDRGSDYASKNGHWVTVWKASSDKSASA
jgi:hypothetical protein